MKKLLYPKNLSRRNEGKIIIALPDTVTGVLVENISSKTAVFTVK